MSRMDNPGESTAGPKSSTVENIREKAEEVGQTIRDMGQQARETARQKYEDLRQQAGEYYETGRQHAMEWEQSLEDYVRQQPVKSLLIAAGVGVLLGALWKRS